MEEVLCLAFPWILIEGPISEPPYNSLFPPSYLPLSHSQTIMLRSSEPEAILVPAWSRLVQLTSTSPSVTWLKLRQFTQPSWPLSLAASFSRFTRSEEPQRRAVKEGRILSPNCLELRSATRLCLGREIGLKITYKSTIIICRDV